ncbi:MAG: FAD-dependent oxidoreductase [Pseudomonadota bacterium]
MQTDVLIAGGGLSGLALADQLARSGRDFVLVEAQGRLGGRILSLPLAGSRFDLGPAWFWPGQPRMAALARRFELPVFAQYTSGDVVFQDRSGAVQRMQGGGAAQQDAYRIDGGMQSLTDALTATLDPNRLRLGQPLRALHRNAHAIDAHLDSGQVIEARHVVLAIPPRVVATQVEFTPALAPDQTASLRAMPTWMAGQAKIIAVFDHPYWRQAGLSGDAFSHRGPMVEIHDASPRSGGPYALFGFVGVPAQTRQTQAAALLPAALEQLTTLFGPELGQPLDLRMQDWAGLPAIATPDDAQMMQTHPRYGLSANLTDLWDGHVRLASTETAEDFGGYLEGALTAADTTAQALSHSAASAA